MAEIGHVSSDIESISWNTICATYKPTWLRICEMQAAVAGNAPWGFPSLRQRSVCNQKAVSRAGRMCASATTQNIWKALFAWDTSACIKPYDLLGSCTTGQKENGFEGSKKPAVQCPRLSQKEKLKSTLPARAEGTLSWKDSNDDANNNNL